MAIATTKQYAGMPGRAVAGGYARAGVNVSSSATINAGPRGFFEARADGIRRLSTGGDVLQVSTGGDELRSGTAVQDTVAGARARTALARVLVGACPVLAAPDTDHRPPDSGMGQKRPHDPRSWGREAESAMAIRVAQACERLGPAGRSLLR